MDETSRWRALFFIYIFMLAFAIVFQGIPPVLGFIVSALGISHAQAGALMSTFGLPGIFISIPGGILSDIYGSKHVGITALAITFAGSLLVGLGHSYSLLVIGRIVSGIGALTISIVAPQVLAQWFAKKDLGKAMGIFNTAMPLGTILTLNVFGRIATISGWRVPLLLSTIYCLVVLVLLIFKFPSKPITEGRREMPDLKESLYSIKSAGWAVWLIAAIWMMYNAAAISYFTFAGDYYVSQGYSLSFAGFLTSLFMVGSLLLSPWVGALTDRFGGEEYFIITGSTLLAVLLLLVPRIGLNPLLLGGLIGIFASFVPSPVFSLVPSFLSPGQIGLGYGILSTCLNIGVLIGPLLVGLSYDLTQSYFPGFNIMALFSLITAIVALILRHISRS